MPTTKEEAEERIRKDNIFYAKIAVIAASLFAATIVFNATLELLGFATAVIAAFFAFCAYPVVGVMFAYFFLVSTNKAYGDRDGNDDEARVRNAALWPILIPLLFFAWAYIFVSAVTGK